MLHARRVVDAAKYSTRDDMGFYGTQRSLFSLRTTIGFLPHRSSLYDEAVDLYNDIMPRQGLSHAEDLDREWGKLSKDILQKDTNKYYIV